MESRESQYIVTFDDNAIECVLPDGPRESIRWDNLDAVLLETNDSGPFATDVWWMLLSRDLKSGCVIPQGATGESALFARLQQLPGFDNEQVIAAMGSTDNQRFLCWQRGKSQGPAL